MASAGGFFYYAADNSRQMFNASADALAGEEQIKLSRTTRAASAEHKTMADFGEDPAYAPADHEAEASERTLNSRMEVAEEPSRLTRTRARYIEVLKGRESSEEAATGRGDLPEAKKSKGFDALSDSDGTKWVPARKSRVPAEALPWAGRLTAKEWRDVDAYNDWIKLVGTHSGQNIGEYSMVSSAWHINTEGRVELHLSNKKSELPLVDAPVRLLSDQGKELFATHTNAKGVAYLYPNGVASTRNLAGAGPFLLAIPGLERSEWPKVNAGQSLELAVAWDNKVADEGDVMLMIDTTGSMGDELRFFQAELINMLTQADHQLSQSVKLRLSVNFYRDRDDDYIVRSFPFTSDLRKAQRDLAAQDADGGGDYAEAVDLALKAAVEDHSWNERARGRILFLVLDAPPHRDLKNINRLNAAITKAARNGIRIVPVAGSGIDKETEFLMRHAAVLTGGTYVYLTDDSGVGGKHLEATGGKSQTERLNSLLTRLIVETMQPTRRGGPSPYQAGR